MWNNKNYFFKAYIKKGVSAKPNSNKKYDLTLYDTAGLEPQSQILTQHLNSDGYILVYSVTDKQSFELIRDVYEKLNEALNANE